ncbi:MAG: RdgB/HAM1 family non-canonical purine NTP pyrophosphatase [Woeseia sp.]
MNSSISRGTRKVVVASDNRGKLLEIRQLLARLPIEAVSQSECGVTAAAETGVTFRENALLKARHAAERTGLAAIADDSGLAVAALDGRPGVYSARYAGQQATDAQNVDKLLADLVAINDPHRGASFHCVAVYVEAEDAAPLVAEGVWTGRILKERRGRGGFGYDPVFFDPLRQKAAAEMSAAEKNLASHRGQAFRELAALIKARAGTA